MAALTFAVACSSGGSSQSQDPPAQSQPPPAPVSASRDAVVTGSAPAGAIVSLHPADGSDFPMPPGPAVMDQYGRQFVPDLLFVRVGQAVEFRNSEDVDHNVQVLRQPAGRTVMNESGSKGQVFTHTFTQPGWYDVICDVHPGMRATIVAASSPLAALADQNGRFVIRNVPQGAYVLNVEARGGVSTREVSVMAPETTISVP